MMGVTPQSKDSFVDCLRKFDIRGAIDVVKKMNIDWIEIGTYFAGGMLAGFLCKKYFKDVVTWLLIAVVVVVIFDYIGLVDIRWDTIQRVVGPSPADTLDVAFHAAFVWAKKNVPLVISFVIGFTVGIKAG